MADLSQLIQSAKALPQVPLAAATAYFNKLSELTSFVDDTLTQSSGIHELIGHNPLQMMYNNHTHHGAFMATVFSIGNYELLARTLPWVYRAYFNHGFSYDYFPAELKSWTSAASRYLRAEDAEAINKIYQWMIEMHDRVIALSEAEELKGMPVAADWLEQKNSFLSSALSGEHENCLQLAEEKVKSAEDIEDFYLQILQPIMYEVGILWEKAEISVAQEHLVSAIVSRVMASINLHIAPSGKNSGKVVIAASPNEYHEIGASMISDLLENDGWQVAYLGASVPEQDLLAHLREYQPDVLALSVTIAFNIVKAQSIVTRIKQDPELQSIKVMVGGRVFNDNEGLWQTVGADAYAANLTDAVRLARSWSQT